MKQKHLILAFITALFISACGGGGGDSTSASNVPAAPGGMTVTAGNAQITPSWTAVSGATSYNAYYGTAAGITTANGIKVTGATSGAAITGLTNGTTYYVAVTAVNATGESALSSEASATPQATATTFAMADLVGTWDRHRLQAGRTITDTTGAITSVTSNWNHGTETVDALGNSVNGVELTSNGNTNSGASSVWSLSADGIITDTADPSFHGTVSGSKDLIVGTRTAGNGIDPRLIVLQKQNPATTFATSDLAGTWDCHRLQAGRTFTDIATGVITGTTNNWNHNVEVWDANGNSITTEDLSSDGTSIFDNPANGNDPYTNFISPSGVVTTADPDQHGIMSASKDLVVITRTPGNGIDVRLIVCQKRDPAVTFTTADLAGTWFKHRLQAGRTFTDVTTGTITSNSNNWNYGIEQFDSNGNATSLLEVSSNPNETFGLPPAWSVSPSGIITEADPTFHGVMSASKDLIVATKTAGNGIDVRLVIFQRR